jgi:hypothetical protein
MILRRLADSTGTSAGAGSVERIRHWATTVLRFCELFLGDRSLAEEVTIDTFGQSPSVATNIPEGKPVQLLRDAFTRCRTRRARLTTQDALHSSILRLAEVDRAIFILHAALSIPTPWVAAIVGASHGETNRRWAEALFQLRDFLLPTGFFEERSK